MNIDDLIGAIEDMRPYVDDLRDIINDYHQILIVGNGGSNAIASHAASDFTNVLHKNAQAFTDATMLTCYINDYGMEYAYLQWLQGFDPNSMRCNTLVILISSSGESKNVINCAEWCRDVVIPFITLTGFEKDNKLKNVKGAELNMWVNSKSYGVVECTHGNFLHSVIDI